MPFFARLLLLFPLCGLGACATVKQPEPQDPYEGFNRSMYNFNTHVDKAVLKPVAEFYDRATPSVVRTGIHNFFSNLDDVIVITNDLLQGKFHQAAADTTRFTWNTTAGLFGLIDVATPMNLPKHDEDFGQTLGVWGFETGPYLVLPLLGPSDVRDGVGAVGYWYEDPVGYIYDPNAYWGAVSVRAVDKRAELLSATRLLEQAALDPYIFTREAYLQIRRSKVHDGKVPAAQQVDPFEEEFDPTAPEMNEESPAGPGDTPAADAAATTPP